MSEFVSQVVSGSAKELAVVEGAGPNRFVAVSMGPRSGLVHSSLYVHFMEHDFGRWRAMQCHDFLTVRCQRWPLEHSRTLLSASGVKQFVRHRLLEHSAMRRGMENQLTATRHTGCKLIYTRVDLGAEITSLCSQGVLSSL